MYKRVRRIIITALCVIVLTLAGGAWLAYEYVTDSTRVRAQILDATAIYLPEYRVQVGKVDCDIWNGIAIRDISISKKDRTEAEPDILQLPLLKVRIDPSALLSRKLVIKSAELHKPVVRVRQRGDGTLDLPLHVSDSHPIRFPSITEVELRDGKFILDRPTNSTQVGELQDVNALVRLGPDGKVTWDCRLTHPTLSEVRSTGKGDTIQKRVDVEAVVTKPMLLADLAKRIPQSFVEKVGDVKQLRGDVEVGLIGSYTWVNGNPVWSGRLKGEVQNAAFIHPRLPFPVKQASGKFIATNDGFDFSDVKLHMGPIVAESSGKLRNWNDPSLESRTIFRGIPFNDLVYRSLPVDVQQVWERLSPEGEIDVDITQSGPIADPKFSVECDLRDVAVSYFLFPYRAEKGRGKLNLTPDGKVTFAADGFANGKPISATGSFDNLKPGCPFELQIDGKRIPADKKIEAALRGPMLEVYRNFKFAGEIDVQARFWRPAQQAEVEKKIDVDLHLDSLLCRWFQYEILDVTGKVEMLGDRIKYSKVVGNSQNALFRIDGQAIYSTDGPHVEVFVDARDVPVNSKLMKALPESVQASVAVVQGRGIFDFIGAFVKPPTLPLDVRWRIDPSRLSIQPIAFPYRLDRFKGQVDYNDERIFWKNLQAMHGDARIQASGSVTVGDDKRVLRLTDLVAINVPYDDDMRRAVPADVREAMDMLQPSRAVTIEMPTFAMEWRADGRGSTETKFDGKVSFPPMSVIPAAEIKRATGSVAMAGHVIGDNFTLNGNVDIRSMSMSGLTATNVTARLRAKNGRCDLENAQGDFYGGRVNGIVRSQTAPFKAVDADFTVSDARLSNYVRETVPNPPSIDGKVGAQVIVMVRGKDLNQISGDGNFRITEADVFRLPVLQDVFRVASLQQPTGRAFDVVEGNFQLKDKVMTVQNLALLGPSEVRGPSLSLVLVRPGTVNLKTSEMELRLGLRYAKGQLNIPGLTKLVNTFGDNLIKVHVHGTLDSPQATLEPIPGIGHFFRSPRQDSNQQQQRN